MNFLFCDKIELKVFFIVWLCLFFIFSPIFFGLSLTPKILTPQAQAWPSAIAIAGQWAWQAITWAWDNIKDWAIATWTWVKNNIVRILKEAALAALKMLLHKILAMVTNSIIKWIQSDFNGQPGFVTDWRSYLNKAAQAAAGRFLNSLAGVNLCSAFKPHIRLTLSLPVPEFKEGAACTLDGILANVDATIDDFYNDFSKGGWKAWDAMASPNNNAFGAYLMAMDAKYALEFAESQKAEKEAKSGFKPTKKCLSTNETQYSQNKGNCDAWYEHISNPGTQYDQNQENCDAWYEHISAGTADQSVIDAYQANCSTDPVPPDQSVVDAYQANCGNQQGSGDASATKPDSADCSSSITTAPDGTVEYTANIAALAPMKALEGEIAQLMGKGAGATFTPYIMAITNALITQLANKSMKGLLEAVVQKDAESGTEPSYDRAAFQNEISGIQNQSKEFEELMADVAETEMVKANLDGIKSENVIAGAKGNYDKIASRINQIRSKQLSVIVDKWSIGSWGEEAVATPETPTVVTIIKSCNATTNACTFTPTAPAITNMTDYSVTTTTTTTKYAISHSKIGQASITKTEVSIIDSRTNDQENFDMSGDRINDYDSTTVSYSLDSLADPADGEYKCRSDYSPSAIICQIDIDDTDPTSNFYALQSERLMNIPELISNTKTALDNFAALAETYSVEFQKDSSCATGSGCAIAKAATGASRSTVISALQALTGDTSSTTIKDLNIVLSKIAKDASAASASSSSIVVTATAPDGTESKADAGNYYQEYLNAVTTMYNSL